MRSVGTKNTAPELLVRRALHHEGFRYRLHVRGLPGTPDIALARFRTLVFVNGCFWHGHDCPHGAVQAKTNAAFWSAKIAANQARDERKIQALRGLGWHVEVVWECQADSRRRLHQLFRALRRQLTLARRVTTR